MKRSFRLCTVTASTATPILLARLALAQDVPATAQQSGPVDMVPSSEAAAAAAAAKKPPRAEGKDEKDQPAAEAGELIPEEPLKDDKLPDAGYLPGYKTHPSFGLSPHSPRVGALPSGLTPGFGAPRPETEWTFRWNGFMSISAQYSMNRRQSVAEGQSSRVFHAPPDTVDEYGSFVGTNTVQGHWVAMNFSYGNRNVTATVTLSTWNPTQPATYYQFGSQNFINNAFMAFELPEMGKLHLHATAGYFFNNYGTLGQYGLGMYQNPIGGSPRGVGGAILAEYDLSPELVLTLEEGVIGSRNGKAAGGTAPAGPNAGADPTFPAAFVQHAHLGLIYKTDWSFKLQLHHFYNFSNDDRGALDYTNTPFRDFDNPISRGIDESIRRDSHINLIAADASILHPVYGMFAVAASHLDAENSYALKGLMTFAGDGQSLAERWLGLETGGTGQLDVLGVNYSGSLGRIVSHPVPFDPGPDLVINAGAILARTATTNPAFGGRTRHKYGLDVLYSFLPFLSAGVRGDRVVPTSKDADETFHVLATRLVFKTDWSSRDNVTLLYAKWFYGPNSHKEYNTVVAPRLDDELISLNANMWW